MANHAGFAAVAQVRDSAVADVLKIYHRSGELPSSLAQSEEIPNPIGPGTASVDLSLFLEAPSVVLEASDDNRVRLDLRLSGEVHLVAPPLGELTRTVLITTTVSATPVLSVLPGGARLSLQASGIQVDSLQAVAIGGPPLPSQLVAFLSSAQTRGILSLLLQAAFTEVQAITPPLFTELPVSLGIADVTTITGSVVRVLDGAIAVGIDVSAPVVGLATAGNVAAIPNFLSQSQMALCLHPGTIDLFFRTTIDTVKEQALAEQGVTIDTMDVAMEPENVRITGHATKGDFGGSFGMRVKPYLGKEETVEYYDDEYGGQYSVVTPGSDDIWFDVYDVDIDAELPWYVYLGVIAGSVVLAWLSPVIIATVVSVVASVKGNIARQIEKEAEGGTPSASRTQRVSLPGTTTPLVDFTMSQLKMGSGGIQSRSWVVPQWGPGGRIEGPAKVAVEEAFAEPIVCRMTPAPKLWHPDDPLVRIRWQVRRTDTNDVIINTDRSQVEAGADRCSIDINTADWQASSGFTVACRVYRVVAPGVFEELANEKHSLAIIDPLDRSRPYVRWWHTVHVEVPHDLDTGQVEVDGYWHWHRKSAIHRTALPGRCRFAGRYADDAILGYLDELPFPGQDLGAHRDEICEYCFFGGPDKTEPLI